MTTRGRGVGAILVLAALVASGLVKADDDDTIDYRTRIMKTMAEQSAAIDMIIQNKVPADNLSVHLRILAVTASTALKAFEPNVPGGHAKAEVWAKWPDFSKRMNELTANLTALSNTSGSIATATPVIRAALTCKGCHDIYCQPMDK